MNAYIVLATFNGERWLKQQLDSLLVQSETAWRLIARDDGSNDASAKILAEYAERDARFEIVEAMPNTSALGAAGNFGCLLEYAHKKMGEDRVPIFLCDQDDVWDADKIAVQLQDLAVAPASCHDVEYMDEEGQLSGRQMLAELRLPVPTVDSLLAQNSVIGCSMAMRSEVLDLALPFPQTLVNHDWWLALCATCLGDLVFDDTPRVKYRQHASNVVGGYRPIRQLGQLPKLYRRQRQVLKSQLDAVSMLCQRLQDRGNPVPDVLHSYMDAVGSARTGERFAALSNGRFAATSRPLRALRAIAGLQRL